MSLRTIKEILIERDGETEESAQERIDAAKADCLAKIEDGDSIFELDSEIMMEHFSLEPDYFHEIAPDGMWF